MDRDRLIKYINDYFNDKHCGKHFLLMLFKTEMELGVSSTPNKWECCGYRYFDNGVEALNAYANTPNPASQLLDSKSKTGLINEALRCVDNMKNEKWLEENLYPYM